MSNPLLASNELPPFSAIRPEHAEPAIQQVIAESRAELTTLLASGAATWESLAVPLEEMQHRLTRVWSPIGHLNGVANSEALRSTYANCLPILSAWQTELGQNTELFRAFESLAEHQLAALSKPQRTVIEHTLREFRLAGVGLPAAQKERFKTLMQELSSLQSKFDNNVLDATTSWFRQITTEAELAGLPQTVIDRARATAQAKNREGWLFSLDAPNYQAVLTYATTESLREEFYTAWVTRASDQRPGEGRWDNSPLLEQILALRYEVANLVGFKDFASFSLAKKMASSTTEVREFLERLVHYSRPVAERELADLTAFAGRPLQAWDLSYYAEKLKQSRLSLAEEALRPYFPLPRVLEGLFAVATRLYGVQIVERTDVDLYHPDVRAYDVLEADVPPTADGQRVRRASFFVDLYARPKKRGGAWMDECVGRKHLGSAKALPVAYLVCNFTPPVGTRPSLLTHSEVVTLFHEFGHGLHHMLTRVDYPSVAGINGVAWDAVELPSQFMENFAWQPEVLPLISGHVETGEPLPQIELERLLASRTFHSGLQTVRQLEFALFDWRVHSEPTPPSAPRVFEILAEVRAQVAVVHTPEFNRFPCSFQHVFSGGYAAGYYSYKWAEVLAADAFSAFQEHGIFDATTSRRFLSSILEQGGSRDAMEMFIDFRGRKPEIAPLLRQLGLAA